jgi:hypothetical protein
MVDCRSEWRAGLTDGCVRYIHLQEEYIKDEQRLVEKTVSIIQALRCHVSQESET